MVTWSVDLTQSIGHEALAAAWLLAVEDPDVLGQMRDMWNVFIESGQVWALLIGLFLGYLFRTFTSY